MCLNISEIKMREPVWSAGVGLPAPQMAGTGGKTSRERNTTMPPFQIIAEAGVVLQLILADLIGGKEI